jgi:hypothetical protein
MKLINKDTDARWIIVDEVSDDDALVLNACGFTYSYDVDENGYNGEDDGDYQYEIWNNVNKL